MKSKKVKKILLIALTCVAISASVSAEAAMKSQITIESKNKYEQLKISESRVYGEYPTGDYKKIMLLPSVSKVEKFCFEDNLNIEEVEWMASVDTVPVFAFSTCPKLKRVILSDNVKKIGQSAFIYCGELTSVKLPQNLQSIDFFAFADLLKNQENMLCGYVYFQKTSQNEMADFLKIDQAVLKNLMGSEKNTLVNFRSIGIEPKMRNKGLSEILFSFAIEYSQKILKADYMLGAFWKKYDEIPMESNLRKFKFEHLLTVKNMWYENEKLICPVCKGRCTCSAEIYIKELKEEMQ